METIEFRKAFHKFMERKASFAVVMFDGMCAYILYLKEVKQWQVGFRMGSMDFGFYGTDLICEVNKNKDGQETISVAGKKGEMWTTGRVMFEPDAVICVTDINQIQEM